MFYGQKFRFVFKLGNIRIQGAHDNHIAAKIYHSAQVV